MHILEISLPYMYEFDNVDYQILCKTRLLKTVMDNTQLFLNNFSQQSHTSNKRMAQK